VGTLRARSNGGRLAPNRLIGSFLSGSGGQGRPGVDAPCGTAFLYRHFRTQAKKVLGCLKSIIKDAKRRGNVAQNVASDVTISANKRD
jgi:hypothetical protein